MSRIYLQQFAIPENENPLIELLLKAIPETELHFAPAAKVVLLLVVVDSTMVFVLLQIAHVVHLLLVLE